MSNVLSNTFWAVFYGSTLGTLTVYLITSTLDEYRKFRTSRRLEELYDQMEDCD